MAELVYGIINIIRVARLWLFYFVLLGVHLQSRKSSILWTCNRKRSK